jgi:Fe-S-cluster containining protein
VIKALSREYQCLGGAPAIREVDTALFVLRYFMRCMECTFCHDACCSRGCDVDLVTVAALRARAPEIEAYTGAAQADWFEPGQHPDPDSPGGAFVGTTVRDGRCVFLDWQGRGCKIHSFCLSRGLDYHALKPPLCSLFPAIAVDGRLKPNLSEALYENLVCRGEGPTFYDGSRDELLHYAGAAPTDPDHAELLRASGPAPLAQLAKPPSPAP